MPPIKWLVIGISGATNSGKTTLSNFIKTNLSNTQIVHQDDYFLPEDSSKHVFIPELNHFNWEILSSLDMPRMFDDITKILNGNRISTADLTMDEQMYTSNSVEDIIERLNINNVKILLIEGFSILNYQPIEQLCHMRYFFTLPYDICKQRREKRVYQPPDVPGYFDQIVWPYYERYRDDVKQLKHCIMLNGTKSINEHYQRILTDLSGIFIHNKLLYS